MAYTSSNECCGVSEIADIGDSLNDESISAIIEVAQDAGSAFYTFTLSERQTNALAKVDSLVRYIRRHKLGTVKRIPTTKNPGSGNMLSMWVWAADAAKLAEWTPA